MTSTRNPLLSIAADHPETQAWLFDEARAESHPSPASRALQQARVARVGLDCLRDGEQVDSLAEALAERPDADPLHVLVSELAAAVVALAHELRDRHEALPRRVDGLERALNSL